MVPKLLLYLLLYLLLLLPSPAHAQIPLEVRIGGAVGEAGRFVVQDLGQYLSILYNYLIGIAGVLATVMIVVGGFRWLLAAGDPGKIGDAKETIGSAVIGLALALGSFLILNTINPQLVELRLPYVPKVQQEQFVFARRCSGLPDSERLFLAGETRRPGEAGRRLTTPLPPTATSSFTLTKANTECGKDYYYTSGGSATCNGDANCPAGNECMFEVERGAFACKPAAIKGVISFSDARYFNTGVGDATDLKVLCRDGDSFTAAPVIFDKVNDGDSGMQRYVVSLTKEKIEEALKKCGGIGTTVGEAFAGTTYGFFIRTDGLNDPLIATAIGTAGEALDDRYGFGKKACTADPKPFFFLQDPDDPDEVFAYPHPEGFYTKEHWQTFADRNTGVFWSSEELLAAVSASGPITCDIQTNLERFPAR